MIRLEKLFDLDLDSYYLIQSYEISGELTIYNDIVSHAEKKSMTYTMTLLSGRQIDINCPYCKGDEFRSQGPRKHTYHMFRCNKCGKCHSRFLDTGKLVVNVEDKQKWEYGLEKHEECNGSLSDF